MHSLQELVRLHRMGTGARKIAHALRMSPNTERSYRRALSSSGLLEGAVDDLPTLEALKEAVARELGDSKLPQHTSTVECWRGRIEAMLENGATPTAIYDTLRLQEESFTGSLSAVKRLCARATKERGVCAEDVVIPVETPPGKVAQVDFGYVGQMIDPLEKRERRAWVFVMTLCYSRHQFVRIVFDQKVETWIRLHVEAFESLGGVPEVIVPDNLKAAVIRAAFGVDDDLTLNRSYRELARHFGFMIDPTPPRSPEKKGKVESGVKYVKNNFFKPRRGEQDYALMSQELERWVVEIAGVRRHGTTQKRPLEVFETIEKPALLALPTTKWRPVYWHGATVHPDTHVLVKKGLYSVPWRFVGKRVFARLQGNSVEIYFEDTRVTTHDRVEAGKRSTKEEHLPEHRREFRHRNRDYWEKRAAELGGEVAQYIKDVFESDDVHYQLRVVQQIVRHLETFPLDRARAACKRASFYGNYKYSGIKKILKKALDKEPLPTVVLPERGEQEELRFARDPRELLSLPLEDTDAPH